MQNVMMMLGTLTNIDLNFMFDDLNDSNILLYAAKCYKRLRYVKRLLHRYRLTGEIKERLLLNHLVILQNVFGVEASTRMLFTRIDSRDYSALKTFLVYTSAMPKIVQGIYGEDIISSDISLDAKIIDILRQL